MFGVPARDGLRSLPIPKEILKEIRSEEDLEHFLYTDAEEEEIENEASINNETNQIPNTCPAEIEDETPLENADDNNDDPIIEISIDETVAFPQGISYPQSDYL